MVQATAQKSIIMQVPFLLNFIPKICTWFLFVLPDTTHDGCGG